MGKRSREPTAEVAIGRASSPTPIAGHQLDAVVAVAVRVLNDAILGVALHGSAASGGLRPRSDLDILVVAARPTTNGEKRRLVDALVEISDRDDRPGFERPVELTIVVQDDVRPWRYPPRIDFLYGEWLRADLLAGAVEPERPTSTDLPIVLANVLAADYPVVGPPPSELLEPVPFDDLVRAMTAELDGLLDELATDTRNVILTLARILATLETGRILPKDAAAKLVMAHLDPIHRPILARARASYRSEEAERWDDLQPALAPFADAIVAAIRNRAAERLGP